MSALHLEISLKIVNLNFSGNLRGNSYTKFVTLDIKFHFTCDKSDMYYKTMCFPKLLWQVLQVQTWKFWIWQIVKFVKFLNWDHTPSKLVPLQNVLQCKFFKSGSRGNFFLKTQIYITYLFYLVTFLYNVA